MCTWFLTAIVNCTTLFAQHILYIYISHIHIELEWLTGIIGESVDMKVVGTILGRKMFSILQLW